jgi:shikimate dehydrogenase
MAKAVVAAFRDSGFKRVTIASRNETTGKALADKYGFTWVDENQISNLIGADVLVNVTPLGMSGGNEGQLSFPEEMVERSKVVFEVIAMPIETPLYELALKHNKAIITGMEIMALQAAIQFELYTGIKLTSEQIRRASQFSRQ